MFLVSRFPLYIYIHTYTYIVCLFDQTFLVLKKEKKKKGILARQIHGATDLKPGMHTQCDLGVMWAGFQLATPLLHV